MVYSHRSPDGRWLPGGASSVGAGLVARELPGLDLDDLAERSAGLLPTDLLRYPLVSAGERFPFVAPDATDTATRPATSDAETLASLLQGTAYVERLCLDTLAAIGAPATGRVVLSGGASRNRVWSQLRADVLGRPVELLANPQPALGMAVLARAAVQAGTSLVGTSALTDAVRQMVSVERVVEHRDEVSAAHSDGYARFVDPAGRARLARAPGRRRGARRARGGRPMSLRVVLIRHGESVWHDENRYAGVTDIELTERGRDQGRVAGRLGRRRRAGRGLELAAEPGPRDRPAGVPRHRPGARGGRPPARGGLRGGRGPDPRRDGRALPRRPRGVPRRPRRRPLPRRASTRPRPPSATSRCCATLQEEHDGGRVLVVAHSTALRVTLCRLLGLPVERLPRPAARTCATARSPRSSSTATGSR